MTREEKANKLGQEYFPDESNIWARANFEAQWVSEACIKMAEWEHKRLIEKACDWLYDNFYEHPHEKNFICSENFATVEDMIAWFQIIMEE